MSASFFRLQQLISPSLPIGAFTYSQGMEWASEAGWLSTADDVNEWLHGLLIDSLSYFDLPLLIRLHTAALNNDVKNFTYYNEWLLAGRETAELRAEEMRRGRALVSVLKKLPDAQHWQALVDWECTLSNTQLAGYALACAQWNIKVDEVLQGYAWGWLDNMVNAAVRLIPLGQSDGQRLLFLLSDALVQACEDARAVKDDAIASSSVAMAVASSQHETQYCRIFRS